MPSKTVYYASVGPELTLYDIDVDGAALAKRGTVTLPANIQYAWPHPSRRTLYVVSSNGGPGVTGDRHFANALAIDPATGTLRLHGDPAALPSRPIHVSVDAQRRLSAHRLQRSEQRHRPSPQRRRHDRRGAAAARRSRHRHLRASGAGGAGQPRGDAGNARQQCRRPASRRIPARSRLSPSTTACCVIWPRSRPATHRARIRLRAAPSRLSSGETMGLRLDRAAEQALRLQARCR